MPSADEDMATTLAGYIGSFPDAQIVALVGNVHALKTEGMPFNSAVQPMASVLAPFKPISLRVAYAAGTAWNCTNDGCGVHAIGHAPPRIPPLEITMDPSARSGYDGQIWLASANASPPANGAQIYENSSHK